MEIKPISLETSEKIKKLIEIQKLYKDLFWEEVYKFGVESSKIINEERLRNEHRR